MEKIISECLKNNITSVDVLGFEYEMGLFPTVQEEAKAKGLRLVYKQIPMEVFDKRAVAKDEVVFHNVAFVEFKPHFNDRASYLLGNEAYKFTKPVEVSLPGGDEMAIYVRSVGSGWVELP